MTLDNLEIACRVLLNDNATLPIDWENQSLDETGAHYSCQFIPEVVENLALDFNGIQDHNGIFQVNINLNKDKGKEGLTGYLSELETIFNRGTTLSYGGVTGFVERVYYNSGVVNNEWFTVSFSVDVRSLS